MKAASFNGEDIETKVNNFFHWLEKENMPYVTMTKIYQQFNDEYIVKPYLTLQRAWVEQSEKKLYSLHVDDRLFAASSLLKNHTENANNYPQEASDFLNVLSKALCTSFQNIILQNFSEVIDFKSPKPTKFELILQTSLYKQLELFLSELGGQKPKNYLESLWSDINIFEQFKTDHPYFLELKNYRHNE